MSTRTGRARSPATIQVAWIASRASWSWREAPRSRRAHTKPLSSRVKLQIRVLIPSLTRKTSITRPRPPGKQDQSRISGVSASAGGIAWGRARPGSPEPIAGGAGPCEGPDLDDLQGRADDAVE